MFIFCMCIEVYYLLLKNVLLSFYYHISSIKVQERIVRFSLQPFAQSIPTLPPPIILPLIAGCVLNLLSRTCFLIPSSITMFYFLCFQSAPSLIFLLMFCPLSTGCALLFALPSILISTSQVPSGGVGSLSSSSDDWRFRTLRHSPCVHMFVPAQRWQCCHVK